MAWAKYHKVAVKDCEAVYYDGTNAKNFAKLQADVVHVDTGSGDVRFRSAGSVLTLHPGSWLVRDGNDFYAVKDSDFQNDYVDAK